METDRFFEQHQGHTERIFLVCSALAYMGPYLPSPISASGLSFTPCLLTTRDVAR
jgi:hypothetical protein